MTARARCNACLASLTAGLFGTATWLGCGGTASDSPRNLVLITLDTIRRDHVITIEDGVRAGGIGMMIADQVCALDVSTPVSVLGLPTSFIPHDPKPANIHARFGLDVAGLTAVVRDS